VVEAIIEHHPAAPSANERQRVRLWATVLRWSTHPHQTRIGQRLDSLARQPPMKFPKIGVRLNQFNETVSGIDERDHRSTVGPSITHLTQFASTNQLAFVQKARRKQAFPARRVAVISLLLPNTLAGTASSSENWSGMSTRGSRSASERPTVASTSS
jgi:hypothetical protein